MLVGPDLLFSHRGLSFVDEAELGGVLPPLHLLQVRVGFLQAGMRPGSELSLGQEVETGLRMLTIRL